MFNMMSIGKKAVTAAEKQLEVTANNMANVDTQGYSRQRVIQEDADPINHYWANIPNGVNLVRIERMRDLYLDIEYRKQNGDLGYWGTRSQNLQELEKNVIETSEYGINAMINNFFNAWESLSDNPFSTIHRMDVVSSAEDMIYRFQDLYRSIDDKIVEIKFKLEDAANRINQISDDMAHILNQISMNEAMGTPHNQLLDKFDLLLDELSGYGNVSVQTRENGTKSVYFGTVELVRNNEPQHLQIVNEKNYKGDLEYFLAWDNIKTPLSGVNTGSIMALYDLKDNILPGYQQKLDELAVQITQQVNAIHTQGYNNFKPPSNGNDFFDPETTGVMNWKISKEVAKDPDFIATSLDTFSGDNQIALQITDLRHSKTFFGSTLTEAFADVVYIVGNDVKMAKQSEARADLIARQTDGFRESVKGVSVNEETANLMKYQQTYQAAAKIISAADEMLRTILGMV
jgi:flagellar hook-associated protein 1 FlgK